MGRQRHSDGDGHDRRLVERLSSYKARGANVVEVVLTVVAFAGLRQVGVVANTPLWIYVALTIAGGTVSPIALAVLRLITSSYLVGACTGRSAGFSPRRMRST